MVQRCQDLARSIGAVEICRRINGCINGASDYFLRWIYRGEIIEMSVDESDQWQQWA
jgi:hypothetical protein